MEMIGRIARALVLIAGILQPSKGQSLAEMRKQFEDMKSLPFSSNPFFARTVSDSGKFEGNGTEGIKPDITGYSCQWIGNLNCTSDFKFQCDGGGIIDCTGGCPGDEQTLASMIKMIGDPELAEKFPALAEMQKKQGDKPNPRFIEMIRGCGFEKMLALLSIGDTGFGDAQDSEITHVDETALSGFGNYDYDYDEEEETDAEAEPETDSKDTVENEVIEGKSNDMDEVASRQEEIPLNSRKQRSADDPDQSLKKTSSPKILQRKKRSPLDQIREEVGVLRRSFKMAAHLALQHKLHSREKRSSFTTSSPKMKNYDAALAQSLADKMKHMDEEYIRKVRSVSDDITVEPVMEMDDKCLVKNMSCVTFPTRKQCQGITIGGCISNTKLLSMLFSPRVILFIVIGIGGFIMAVTFIGYYWCYLRRNGNQVEPQGGVMNVNVEPGEDESANGDVRRAKQMPYRPNGPNPTSTA